MKRVVLTIVTVFIAGILGGAAFAASDKCTIVSIAEKRLVIECDKPGKSFKEGDRLKIKTSKKRQQVEGC